MAPHQIVTYGSSPLHTPAVPVEVFSKQVSDLAAEMVETMRAARGVGLAAPQIGRGLRIFVVEWQDVSLVAVNPAVALSGPTVPEVEGCLSIPGAAYSVDRSMSAVLSAFSVTGRHYTRRFDGFAARIIQHEMDHLDGVLIADCGLRIG